MAKSEQQKLKDKLDTVFSKFIRLSYADKNGYVHCFTCGTKRYWQKDGMQNGHYVHRGILITRFEPLNCRPQCEDCNLWKEKNTMQITYREELVEDIGEEEVRKLEKKRNRILKVDTCWYKNQIDFYELKVKELSAKISLR